MCLFRKIRNAAAKCTPSFCLFCPLVFLFTLEITCRSFFFVFLFFKKVYLPKKTKQFLGGFHNIFLNVHWSWAILFLNCYWNIFLFYQLETMWYGHHTEYWLPKTCSLKIDIVFVGLEIGQQLVAHPPEKTDAGLKATHTLKSVDCSLLCFLKLQTVFLVHYPDFNVRVIAVCTYSMPIRTNDAAKSACNRFRCLQERGLLYVE